MSTPVITSDAAAAANEPAAGVPVHATPFSRGVRETIESIAIALALAFLFKTFEAEAFVIPTGSMAPTLLGRHKDVACPECGYRYTASGSDEADRNGNERNDPNFDVIVVTCPNCRRPLLVDPRDPQNAGRNASPSYSGDRIWVSKVPYHFADPERFDVVVFRFPEEAETYYIKRLVGLPNETVRIFHGDLYVKGPGENAFEIVRKPPDKLLAMAQIVHDNDCVSEQLNERGWPLRWQIAGGPPDALGQWQVSDDTRVYRTDGKATGDVWIRYEHTVPSDANWLDERWPPGYRPRPQLITDFYAFNARELRRDRGPTAGMLGLHWVGDLLLECDLDVKGDTGAMLFDLVKAGRHFGCNIDVATGQARLSIDAVSSFQPTAQTAIRGPGKHRVRFAHADRQLFLWVDDSLVTFDLPTAYDDLGSDNPRSTQKDPGDLAPARIGSRGAAVEVSRLRLLRDIYYIADKSTASLDPLNDYHGRSLIPQLTRGQLADFLASPERWGENFSDRLAVDFELGDDQFFVLGDNSPASSDARLWGTQHYVERDLLVGKALFVYWPHALPLFIPFTDVSLPILPNVQGMGLIR